MKPNIVTYRYIECPTCKDTETFSTEHLLDGSTTATQFGPWYCNQCRTSISGTIHPDKTIDLTKVETLEQHGIYPTLSLLCLENSTPNIYLIVQHGVVGDKEGQISHWDYFFHSHQCSINLLQASTHVFTTEETDPHGLFRFVASIEHTEDVEEQIDQAYTQKDIFKIFNTNGSIKSDTAW